MRLLGASLLLTLVIFAVLAVSIAGWIPKEVAVGIGAALFICGSLYLLPRFSRGLTNTQDQSNKNKPPVDEGKRWEK